ncbi:hypothetical protein GCM10022224_067810 [Nonomuraea antimicrobica]|uniref:Uncharacterized protein n=1 Tax=Nonomuraea antimicrobica TaxID=561173 RepID=A0ABP7CPJ4_9ACTN
MGRQGPPQLLRDGGQLGRAAPGPAVLLGDEQPRDPHVPRELPPRRAGPPGEMGSDDGAKVIGKCHGSILTKRLLVSIRMTEICLLWMDT